MNSAFYFLLSATLFSLLLNVAMFHGDLQPRYCIAAQLANGQDQDFLSAITEARRR